MILGTLPPLFVNNGITQVQVITTATTAFDNMAGVAGLMNGNSVSVGGLLFNTATTPTIVADKVLNRQTMEE